MSSQLDPDVGRDDPSPHAPKSADLDEENAGAPKESSGPAHEHQAMAAEPQVPVARPLEDGGPPPEQLSMSDRPDRTDTVESSPCAPKAAELDEGNSTAAKGEFRTGRRASTYRCRASVAGGATARRSRPTAG